MGDRTRPERVLYAIAALAVVLGAMKAAAGVLVPTLLALFIAIVSTGPMYWMVERGVPRWLAILVVVFALLGISSLMPFVISGSFVEFTRQLPSYQARADTLLLQAADVLSDYGYDQDSLRTIFDPAAALGWVQFVLTALGGILSRYFLIMLLVIFILIDVPRSLHNVETAAGQIIGTVQHYFAIKTFTSFLTGGTVSAFLMIMDVDYPLLWGFVAFLFNFVPNIGSVLAAVPAVLLAVLFEGYGTALIVAIGYIVINVGISNAVEPRIMGDQLGLRFVVIFASLILWGWILGPVGMLLAVPLTMTIRIIMDAHPDTLWISDLLRRPSDPEPEPVRVDQTPIT